MRIESNSGRQQAVALEDTRMDRHEQFRLYKPLEHQPNRFGIQTRRVNDRLNGDKVARMGCDQDILQAVPRAQIKTFHW